MIADPQPQITVGDANGDGSVTAEDARLTLRAAVRLDSPSDYARLAMDVDSDGSITAGDAREILRTAVGLTDKNRANSK